MNDYLITRLFMCSHSFVWADFTWKDHYMDLDDIFKDAQQIVNTSSENGRYWRIISKCHMITRMHDRVGQIKKNYRELFHVILTTYVPRQTTQ